MEDGVVPSSADSYAVMRHQVARLRRLATDLKVLTAVEAHALELQIQELKTNAMVSAACGSAELRYEAKGVELRCLQPGSDVVVMADPIACSKCCPTSSTTHSAIPRRGSVM